MGQPDQDHMLNVKIQSRDAQAPSTGKRYVKMSGIHKIDRRNWERSGLYKRDALSELRRGSLLVRCGNEIVFDRK